MPPRNDYRDSEPNPRLFVPETQYPTPNIDDIMLVEDLPVRSESYRPLPLGAPRKDQPTLKLVWQGSARANNNELVTRRIYVTDRVAQDAYNASISHVADDGSSPVYVRSYITLRSSYTRASDLSALTTITGIALTAGGSGYHTAPTVSFSGGGGSGAAAVAEVLGGAVVAIRITSTGTGYTSAPTVAFTGGGGSGATATASIQPTTALLIKEEAQPAPGELASLYYQVTRVYHTLPGPELKQYLFDAETQSNVTVTTQIVQKPGAAYAQSAGSVIEYRPLSDNHGYKVTTTLDNFASVTRTVKSNPNYTFPRLIVGTPAQNSIVANDGTVRTTINWIGREGFTAPTKMETVVTYGSASDIETARAAAVSGGYYPVFNAIVYDGVFFSANERQVLNDAFTLGPFNTSTDNPKWGYVTEDSVSVAASTPTATAYLALVAAGDTVVVGANASPWKYNLWRLEVQKILLR